MGRRTAAARPRNAQATRRALLEAGIEAFRVSGYQHASIRAIADQVGVDAALVKRYFGSKEGLYFAALQEMDPVDVPAHALLAWVVNTLESSGAGPVARTMFTIEPDDERRAAVRGILERLMVEPLIAQLEAEDGAGPSTRLRVELAVALVHGVVLARESGMLSALADVSSEDLIETLGPLLDDLLVGERR